jgi:multiple sugar transport system permease protein
MIPVFVLLRQLGQIWNTNLYVGGIYLGKALGVDSYFALIVPSMFTAYGTFMLRQFFMSLPKELEEAAEIDGCSIFGIYWRITLPLCKPALATLTTFVFMWSWKDFLWPLIVTTSTEMRVLSVGLASFQGLYNTDWTLLMAGSIIMLLPIIIIFIFNQRFFIEGIQLTGIKG